MLNDQTTGRGLKLKTITDLGRFRDILTAFVTLGDPAPVF